jgi:tight adherence protein C
MGVAFDILAAGNLWLSPVWDWIIMIGLFLSVGLLVVSIFSQEGEIQLSPQREAAVATGHADRKTAFENILLRPVLWILLSIAHRLRFRNGKDWLRKQLVAAGSPNFYTPEEYLALSMLAGLGLGVLLEIFHVLLAGKFSIGAIFLGLLAGMSLSIYQIAGQASKRLMSITKELPYAMDLLSLAMGAGATFTEAVGTIIREGETEETPLNSEFRALLAEMDLGTTRRAALQNMARRVPLEAMLSLVASVVQAEELGTPLSTVLRDQATLLRERRSLRAEEKAASAGVRILVPCLLLVMAVLLTVFGPFIIKTIEGGLV